MENIRVLNNKLCLYLVIMIVVLLGTNPALSAQDGFDDLFDNNTRQSENTESEGPSLPVSGELSFGIRSFLDNKLESQTDLQPILKLLLEPSSGD
jgi:hypothetical protein